MSDNPSLPSQEGMSVQSSVDANGQSLQPEKVVKSFRKGALVKVNSDSYANSLEAMASDQLPNYLLDGPGEVLVVKGEYAQVRWRRPVPDTWLRIDQLEDWS